MGHKADITVYQKGLIFGIIKSGKGICEISHELNISAGVISKIIKQGEPTGDITFAHSRCDRKIKIPYRKCHNLIRIVKTSPLMQICSKHSQNRLEKQSVKGHCRMNLKKASFNSRIAKFKPQIP